MSGSLFLYHGSSVKPRLHNEAQIGKIHDSMMYIALG